eukprot:1987060-Karenia_brevis.AAC.1
MEEWQEIVLVVAKIALANEQAQRMLKGIVMQTFKTQTEGWIYIHHKQGIQEFMAVQKEMKDAGKGPEAIKEKIGAPGVFGFNGILKGLKAQPEQKHRGG